MTHTGAPPLLLVTVALVLALDSMTGGAAAAKLIISYPDNTLLRAIAGPGLKPGRQVGSPIILPRPSQIGRLLDTTVTPDGLAFTASLKTKALGPYQGQSYLTVTSTTVAPPKVLKTFTLPGLLKGDLAGCQLAENGDITSEKFGSSHSVFLNIVCKTKCKGVVDRNYVVKYSYSSATKKLAGPSKAIRYLISQRGCAKSEAAKDRRVIKLKVLGTKAAAPGVLYGVIGSPKAGVSSPGLYKLDSGKVTATGVVAKVPYYTNGADCIGAEIRSPSSFYARCEQRPHAQNRGIYNAVAYVSKGAKAALLEGSSSDYHGVAFGPLSIGSSEPAVLYCVTNEYRRGFRLVAHEIGSTKANFTDLIARTVPVGAIDLDVL